MLESEKLKRCADCDDNFYNGPCGKRCWCLADAKPAVVFVVGTWQEWPEKNKRPIDRLMCWKPARGCGLSVMGREAVKPAE